MHFRQPIKRQSCTKKANFGPMLPPPDVINDWLKRQKKKPAEEQAPLYLPQGPFEMPEKPRRDVPEDPGSQHSIVVIDL